MTLGRYFQMETKIRGSAVLSVVTYSVGHRGRLGSLFRRSQTTRQILDVGVVTARGWQRTSAARIAPALALPSGPC